MGDMGVCSYPYRTPPKKTKFNIRHGQHPLASPLHFRYGNLHLLRRRWPFSPWWKQAIGSIGVFSHLFHSWPSAESPGAGERKHVLALRKHAEHQQLSLPAAGPKVENHWKISFLGWRVDGKQEV